MIEAGKKNQGLKHTIFHHFNLWYRGGKVDSEEHAIESAKVLNEMQPNYIGLLTLLLEEGTELYEDVQNGKFQILDPKEVLLETKALVENLEIDNCIFRSNHASNYLSLRGNTNGR